ncbi:MAG TPA: hypothetical protein VJ508_20600, partial [Saprospiraceae bacterium]|nr:hypothetical protein [Saprospiraceae bacterium]
LELAPLETKTLFANSADWEFIDQGQLEDNLPDRVKREIQVSGILPDGEYQICVQAYDFNTDLPVSAVEPAGCQFFTSSLGTPPQLTGPECGATMDQEYPIITWTPAIVFHPMPDLVYDLYVVELTSDALNPHEVMEQSIAYRGGNPFVVENLHTTFYQFLPGDLALKRGAKYAMCIVGRSGRGSAFLENNGRSEICTITMNGNLGESTIAHNPWAPPPPSFELDPNDFQLYRTCHLSGKLLYRFYGDDKGAIISATELNANDLQLMDIKPGPSIENQGMHVQVDKSKSKFKPQNLGGLQNLSIENLDSYRPPPPPQYLLPPGYNTNGGKPLRQARIHFTARYAVGKKVSIQSPDDLQFVSSTGQFFFVTG